jgi:hypothetical protein
VEDGVYAPNLIYGFAAGDAIKFGVNGSATLSRPVSGGEIDFSPTGVDYALLKSGSTLGATINNFSPGDEVDFETVKYASTDTVSYAGAVVSIDSSAGATVASFDVSGTFTSADFKLDNDGAGHLLVSYASAGSTAPTVHADIGGTGRDSPAELLGGYGSWSAGDDSARAIELSTLHVLAPVTTGTGGFGHFGHENDGSVGSLHDGGLGGGWNEQTGHGPGPSS